LVQRRKSPRRMTLSSGPIWISTPSARSGPASTLPTPAPVFTPKKFRAASRGFDQRPGSDHEGSANEWAPAVSAGSVAWGSRPEPIRTFFTRRGQAPTSDHGPIAGMPSDEQHCPMAPRPRMHLVFDPDSCATPCPRFVPGTRDEHGMVACVVCEHWFLDDDPTVADYETGWGALSCGPTRCASAYWCGRPGDAVLVAPGEL
jgi:hypothetical protein